MRSKSQQHSRYQRRWVLAVAAIAAAIAVLIASTALGRDTLPAAAALPCPDGTDTCGPTAPTIDPGPTQGNQGPPTTAPQAQTTLPPTADNPAPTAPQQNGGPEFQGTVQAVPTVTQDPDTCIANCPTPTQAPTQAQQPTLTQTETQPPPTSSATSTTPTAARESQEQCSQPTSGSATNAIRDGKVTYTVPDQFDSAAKSAVSAWKKAGAPPIEKAGSGSAGSSLKIISVNAPTAQWSGRYQPGSGSSPATIEVNTGSVLAAQPGGIDLIIAHEMGHALGIPDITDSQALMNPYGTSKSPAAADTDALNDVLAGKTPKNAIIGCGSLEQYLLARCGWTTCTYAYGRAATGRLGGADRSRLEGDTKDSLSDMCFGPGITDGICKNAVRWGGRRFFDQAAEAAKNGDCVAVQFFRPLNAITTSGIYEPGPGDVVESAMNPLSGLLPTGVVTIPKDDLLCGP